MDEDDHKMFESWLNEIALALTKLVDISGSLGKLVEQNAQLLENNTKLTAAILERELHGAEERKTWKRVADELGYTHEDFCRTRILEHLAEKRGDTSAVEDVLNTLKRELKASKNARK